MRSVSRYTVVTLLSFAIVADGCGPSSNDAPPETRRQAFSNQTGGAGPGGGHCSPLTGGGCQPTHEQITVAALSFLKQDVRYALASANALFDSINNVNIPYLTLPHPAFAHFDNCNFLESSLLVRSNFTRAVEHATDELSDISCSSYAVTDCFVPSTQRSIWSLAASLHAAQDFYAHSNWVEQGNVFLMDQSLTAFPALIPYSTVGGLRIVDDSVADSLKGGLSALLARRPLSIPTMSFPPHENTDSPSRRSCRECTTSPTTARASVVMDPMS